MRTFARIVGAGLVFVLLAAGAAALWARGQLRGSLATLDGELKLTGLSAPVTVTRDALGVPTVRGSSREDVARATGFLHAQDRYFQMDLARRRAAGELARLVGPRALPVDRDVRIHRFRSEARQAVMQLRPKDARLLEAYTTGVNEGLRTLAAPPFEYLILRQTPAPWAPEDSLLVVLSMFVTLQDSSGEYEATLATMRDVLPAPMYDFLSPRGSEWDAPLVGGSLAPAPIPGPEVYDLRRKREGRPTSPKVPSAIGNQTRDRIDGWLRDPAIWTSGELGREREAAAIGSNNFAVAGRLTSNGGALVANDMHLGIRVPNTWYRAAFEWPDDADASTPHRLVGITLPGVPALVVGSNAHVAWGFTNTYADWSDVVVLDVDPAKPDTYRTPDGWKTFDLYDEVIEVAGEAPVHFPVRWTEWGPVLAPDHRGRARAYRWVAHAAERLAASITPLESARTLEEALDDANGLGAPGQNLVVADRSGRIAWSVYGAIPRRVGFSGELPVAWSDGSHRWDGWLSDAEYPRLIDPPGGRIWTANARVVDGEMLAKLGDGSYEIGSRARVIRDRLLARERFTPGDLLDIQLDASTDFLERWRTLIVRTLEHDASTGISSRAAMLDIVAHQWPKQVAADSTAYRLTRLFRDVVSRRVIDFVLAECYEADARFDYTQIRRRDTAVWTLVNEQPLHLLDPRYGSWREFLIAAADTTIEQTTRDGDTDLRQRSWAEYNVSEFRHPLSPSIPFLEDWLDMPTVPLPGDLFTPRVHWGVIGASERMVVSPGREAEGILHMPTGQSGHPLSPFYANSHPAWVNGDATPILPGATVHTLTLTP